MKISMLILLANLLFLTSCEGVFWNGEERSATDDNVNITIIIDDPMWNAYLERLKSDGEE